jgi:membrane-associated phospholipid phosphatase
LRTLFQFERTPKMTSTASVRNVIPRFLHCSLICAALLHGSESALAQTTNPSAEKTQKALPISDAPRSWDQPSEKQQQPDRDPVICGAAHLAQCLKDIGNDQTGIWTSPLRISSRDAVWLLPFAGATGVALHYDAQAQQNLGVDKGRIDTSNTISAFGSPYATFGGAAGLYFLGLGTHNEHLSETGRLGAEAVADASLLVEGFKLATNRERPNEGNGEGGFWPHGTRSFSLDGSFPSGHAAASWALARVIASEYPSKPVQVAAYSFALAISASRVTARQHFPSDVFVGATFGYLIGGYVVRHHAAQNTDSSFSVLPVVDMTTHTFGASMELRPDQLDVRMARRLAHSMRGSF